MPGSSKPERLQKRSRGRSKASQHRPELGEWGRGKRKSERWVGDGTDHFRPFSGDRGRLDFGVAASDKKEGQGGQNGKRESGKGGGGC